MKTSADGRKLIEDFEGLFLEAYDDNDDRVVHVGQRVVGTLTIGYGHTTSAGPPRVYVGMSITAEEADAILSADLTSVELEVTHLVKAKLNQHQFDALVSFQYNTNWLAHPNCSLLWALNSGNFNLAEEDFGLYDRASGKVEAGLQRRRKAEAMLFAGNVAGALALAAK